MNGTRHSSLIGGLIVLALAAQAASAGGAKGTAAVRGKVVFDGTPPQIKKLPPMNSTPACAAMNPTLPADQATIVYKDQGNAIPYVFVYVKEGIKDKYEPPAEPIVLDQKGCIYHPHVIGMVAGQQLNIKNSDKTTHNVHSLPSKNEPFNLAQPQPGVIKREGKETFNKPESPIKIKCDVHGWMSAWCHVMSHPFFDVSKDHTDFPGKDKKGAELKENKAKWGTFEIKDLPAGDYTIEAWHETFGKVQQKVSVKDGETKEVEIKMTGKKAEGPATPERVILASDVRGDEKADAKKGCCTEA